MPANFVRINDCKNWKWYVDDSKMEELIKFLNKIGFRNKDKKSKIKEK